MIIETHSLLSQTSNLLQGLHVMTSIDQGICDEIGSFLGIENMHGSEVLIAFFEADYFLGNLDGI